VNIGVDGRETRDGDIVRKEVKFRNVPPDLGFGCELSQG
jgi:hypothetical protein